MNNRILELAARKLSGEASPEELQELEQWLANDPDAAERYGMMRQFWDEHETLNQAVIQDGLTKTLNRLGLPVSEQQSSIKHEGTLTQKTHRVKFSKLAWAASVAGFIALAGGGWFMMQQNGMSPNERMAKSALEEKQNSKGIKSTITLSDGSKIWLNADSKIQYPKSFTGLTREVYLHGEAFFEVTKNPSRPFIIHLNNGTVRVLGTSFNVRAYDNEKVVETSVATGKVAFIPRYERKGKKQDTIFITPDNKVRYIFSKEQVITEHTLSTEDKAWTEGRLIFKDMTLEDIAVDLERSFGKKIVFTDDAPRQFRLTGSFENNTLDEILFYLSRTKKFNYRIDSMDVEIGASQSESPRQ